MPIKVLIVDDSDVMRDAIRKAIAQEPLIETVGESESFAQAIQAIADCEPDVILLDLHLAEKRSFSPTLVKSRLICVDHILAVSFSNDAEARELAESYGTKLLLDKMKLFNELVPAILDCGTTEKYLNSSDFKFRKIASELNRLLPKSIQTAPVYVFVPEWQHA
jgi:two-component system, NarL family, invasion response regulator UvrY